MENILKKYAINNEYVSVYTNDEYPNKFMFGKIIAANDEFFAIAEFAPNGSKDGLSVMLNEKIIKIGSDSEYTKKMEKLIALNEKASSDYVVSEADPILEVLSSSLEKHEVVSIELISSGYYDAIGIVTQIDNDICTIRQISEYGSYDGIVSFCIYDITKITIGSEDERITQVLYNMTTQTDFH